MSRAWHTCPEPIKFLARRLEAARGSAAPVPVASAAGDVNLATALVLRKLLGDTHAAALLRTLEGGSKSESSVKAMSWRGRSPGAATTALAATHRPPPSLVTHSFGSSFGSSRWTPQHKTHLFLASMASPHPG